LGASPRPRANASRSNCRKSGLEGVLDYLQLQTITPFEK
jgi:hypothetical protein